MYKLQKNTSKNPDFTNEFTLIFPSQRHLKIAPNCGFDFLLFANVGQPHSLKKIFLGF